MPEKYSKEVAARYVQKGDDLGASRGLVTSVAVKQKYTFISDEKHDKPQRFLHHEMILVGRERMTPEEAAAHSRRMELERIDWEEQHAERQFREAAQVMQEYLGNEYLCNHGPYDRLMLAEATWELWRTLRYNHCSMNQIIARDGSHTLRRYGAEDRVITEYSRFDAVKTMSRYIWREITMHGSRLHRSTSIISNAMSDAQMDARVNFMRDMESIIDGDYSDL